jgi:Uma2 family endonuclease
MSQTVKTLYSLAEYFELEDKANFKSEYYHGEIIPMAGGTFNHDYISGNVYIALRSVLDDRKDCYVYKSDVKLKVEEGKDYTYPDAMALCGEPELVDGRKDIIANPTVIFEVLSESTQNEDFTTKFERYKAIQSLQNYILIDQYKVYVECHVKKATGIWKANAYHSLDQTLKIPAINIKIPLSRVYKKVTFE